MEKRIRAPDPYKAIGSDADGINNMADQLKGELDACREDGYNADDWPIRVSEYMASESEYPVDSE